MPRTEDAAATRAERENVDDFGLTSPQVMEHVGMAVRTAAARTAENLRVNWHSVC